MIGSIINQYRLAFYGLTRRIWLLSAVMFINRCGTMVLAFLTLYSRSQGFSVQQAGWTVGVYGIGSVLGAFIGGKLSDKFGFYRQQFLALFFGGCMFWVTGQMKTYLSLCVAIFILAMVNESFRPANATAVAHYSNPKNRTQSFSLIRLAINLGWGFGAAIGGFLAHKSYSLLFWVDGGTNIFASFLLLFLLPKVTLTEQKQAAKQENLSDTQPNSALQDYHFVWFLLLTMLFSICFFQLFTTVPLFFNESLHLSEYQIGTIMAANGVMIALFEMVLVHRLEGRHRYLYLMVVGVILMGLGFFALNMPLANGFIVGAVSIFIITIAEMVSMPFMNSYYISKTNESNRGAYAGYYTMAWSAAQVIGSSMGALVAFQIGYFRLWLLVLVVCVLCGYGYWLLSTKDKS